MASTTSLRAQDIALLKDLISTPCFRTLDPLEDAISTYRQLSQLPAITESDRMSILKILMDLLVKSYKATDNPSVLDNAIVCARSATKHIELTPKTEDIPVLDTLSSSLYARFVRTGSLVDADECIRCIEAFIDIIPPSHQSRSRILNTLATAHFGRFRTTGSPVDIDASIQRSEEALLSPHINTNNTAACLHNLVVHLLGRYELSSSASDMQRAEKLSFEALTLVKEGRPYRREMLSNEARLAFIRFKKGHFWQHLDEAIALGKEAMKPGDSCITGALARNQNLSVFYQEKFRISKNSQDLRLAHQHASEAEVKSKRARHVRMATLDTLLECYLAGFASTGRIQELRGVLDALEDEMDEMSVSTKRATKQKQYQELLGLKYKHTGDHLDLIFLCHEAVQLAQAEVAKPGSENQSTDRNRQLDALRYLFSEIFRFVLVPEYIDIRNALTTTIHQGLLEYWGAGILAAFIRFLKEKEVVSFRVDRYGRNSRDEKNSIIGRRDRDRLIKVSQIIGRAQAKARPQGGAAPLCQFRFRLLDFTITTNPNSEKDVVNIEEAQKAVLRLQSGLDSELGMDKHKQGEDYCRHAKALQARYKHTDKSGNPDASALKEAIVLAESAIDSLMSGSKELRDAIGLRITLAMQRDSIEKTRESADFAVRVLEEAMESRDIGNLSLFVKLNYCQALRARFLSFGSQHDLQRSAEIAKQLLRDSQKDNPGTYHFEKLSIAALVLKSSYQWLGDIEALDDAITCLHQAVGLKVVKENIEEVEENYMTLAFMLRLRFRRTHASQDIQEAAKLSRRVLQRVEAKKIPDENLFALKNNAAIILEDLYSWSEKENDLEEATNLAESLPNASQNINLANMLLKKFDISSKIEDLDRAVLIARSATEHERYTGPHLVMALSDASDVFQAKYRQSLDPVYLKEAIHYARSSLSQSAETVPWLSENLFYFGHMLLTYSMVSDPDRIQARKQGIEVFEKAWINPCGVPSFRLRAAYKAAQLHWLDGARSSASSLLEDAVEYLMVVAPPWLDYRDRQRLLGKLSGLASDAGACAVHNGKSAYDALKVLESSRGVIMGSTMDWRRDISHVAELEPELEREFNRLRMALDSTPEESGDVRLFRDEDDWLSYRRKEGNMKEEVGTARRQKLHKEMSALCDSIRALPGLEDFMGFPKADAIMKLAERGPVVFVFCSKLVGYGRAIVIRTTGIENVHLPELKTAEAEERLRQMKDDLTHGSLRTYASRNKILRDELIWLWEVAVRPVLESMNSEFEPSKAPPKKPHMQWIGVGILSCVPFHAAGYHSSGSTSNTMSHAISSYTSSLRALQYAMKTRQAIDPLSRLLAVTMKETPGAAPLPSADKELENIEAASVAHKAMPVSELRKPNSNQVLDQLPSHNLVHFACHGVSDAVDPFNSRLLFSDAYSKRYGYSRLYADQRPSTLSVRDLMSNRAPKADLAYLSACSTANMKVATLADESIHIASGFQLAGFRHVVASLWEQKDSVCLDIATRFYQELFRLHSESKDIYEGEWPVAVALHKAISEIREHRPEMVIQWASFIHFGS